MHGIGYRMKKIAYIIVLMSLVFVATNAHAFFVYESHPVSDTNSDYTSSSQTMPLSEGWQIDSGQIAYLGHSGDSAVLTTGGYAWTDYTVAVTIDILHGSQAGVFVHYIDENNHYKVVLDGSDPTPPVDGSLVYDETRK